MSAPDDEISAEAPIQAAVLGIGFPLNSVKALQDLKNPAKTPPVAPGHAPAKPAVPLKATSASVVDLAAGWLAENADPSQWHLAEKAEKLKDGVVNEITKVALKIEHAVGDAFSNLPPVAPAPKGPGSLKSK